MTCAIVVNPVVSPILFLFIFTVIFYHQTLSDLFSLPYVQLLYTIKGLFARGQDPVSIDCAGSSHIMGDLWSQSALRLLALVCSCGESWHSSPVGQDTIILHCKECSTICNEWTTDKNNLHEKQVTNLLCVFFFFSFVVKLLWSGKMSFSLCTITHLTLLILKVVLCILYLKLWIW